MAPNVRPRIKLAQTTLGAVAANERMLPSSFLRLGTRGFGVYTRDARATHAMLVKRQAFLIAAGIARILKIVLTRIIQTAQLDNWLDLKFDTHARICHVTSRYGRKAWPLACALGHRRRRFRDVA